ncbi:MAG: flagellar basal body L-ring protein FlgH [Candidatus Zixiibacteriota bacterium]|nr:MAG: flagellar basal body L-ring protein FlgH [candidate division Zixibacteria bacterium]
MNVKRILLILAVLLLLPFSLKVWGGDFGQAKSLFTDIKANRVGDILTVLIYEQAQASTKVEAKTEKSTKASVSGGPGIGSLGFIPLFGADGENSNTFDGKGENKRDGTLRAKMSVTVIEVRDNGDLIIEGSRTIGISGDRETLTLTGVVRQKDISPDNTIDSYLIADAEIHYTGKGNNNTASRPGFVTRLINWLF